MLCASCNERLAQTNGFFFRTWYDMTDDVRISIKHDGANSKLEVQYTPWRKTYNLILNARQGDANILKFQLPKGFQTFTLNGKTEPIELPSRVGGKIFQYDIHAKKLTQIN